MLSSANSDRNLLLAKYYLFYCFVGWSIWLLVWYLLPATLAYHFSLYWWLPCTCVCLLLLWWLLSVGLLAALLNFLGKLLVSYCL